MVTNARGQKIIAGTGEPVTRARINALLDEVYDIRPVATLTARAQLVAALTTAGLGPSPARPLYVDREDAPAGMRLERTYNGTSWDAVPTMGSVPIPMIGIWSASKLVATNLGSQLLVTGTVATTGGTVPAGASTNVGVVPGDWRPSELKHATLSGQILGAGLVYSARGSLVVEPSGNVSVYTEALTTTCQVSMVVTR